MKKNGFTLIEFLAVVAIIGIITATAAVSYNSMRFQFALLRSTHKISQDMRRAQEMATSSKEVPNPNNGGQEEVPEGGFGIYLNEIDTPPYYQIILFADFNNNKEYNSGNNEWLENIELEQGVVIDTLPFFPLNITFKPPNPKVTICNQTCSNILTEADIKFSLETDSSKTRSIKVNEAGLIYVYVEP